jgi:hypothetical protein
VEAGRVAVRRPGTEGPEIVGSRVGMTEIMP